jgi:Putative peptidoglycan binding domain
MDCSQEDFVDALLTACQQYLGTLSRYGELCLRGELNEEEIQEMESIYTNAESAPLLNFLVTEFDRILGQRIGLLNKGCITSYKNQQAWLREHLEQIPIEQSTLISTQKHLQEEGFYKGPLDGVWGNRSRKAAIKYRKKVQEVLKNKGFYDGSIDGELGNASVVAVQEFQKSQDLSNDGVPGKLTYSALLE